MENPFLIVTQLIQLSIYKMNFMETKLRGKVVCYTEEIMPW